jgi:GH15 family glucan-1,4-alpha-glucosidase
MPPRGKDPDVVRIVEGISGRVAMECVLNARFDYGATEPWVRSAEGGLHLVAGPDAMVLRSPIELPHEGCDIRGSFEVAEGDRVPFVLTWFPSHEDRPEAIDADASLRESEDFWSDWASRSTYSGPRPELVTRSLLTLKGLIFSPTGGIVAAATTSLPELIGGVRNWDYRYCWLRDATFTLYALYTAGYSDEAVAWRDWLLRAIAGRPDEVQIMYGVLGERRLTEYELPWLAGYEGSGPVRIGNAATQQFQLDIYGEVMDAMHLARRSGVDYDDNAWQLQLALMEELEGKWQEPDEGIWEVRGDRQHFTHSKVLAWVAADRAVKAVESFGRKGPGDDWRRLRAEIHTDVCEKAWNADRGAFVQAYGSERLDASTLLMPLVGFVSAKDDRMVSTIEKIGVELNEDGFLHRYHCGDGEVDGLPGTEGAFLACTFWWADCLALQGKKDEATEIFERICGIANDVGLLSEQYDPAAKRMLGNFPQALSHVSLVNTGQNLCPDVVGPGEDRPGG